MGSLLSSFVRENAGVLPVEYALIAAIVTVAMTVAASAAGFSLADIIS